MKRVLMAAAALAALGVAGSAFADDSSQTLTINASAPAQCHITAANTSITLSSTALVGTDGFVKTGVTSDIASGLTGLGITAWCTGNHNGVNLFRTALVNQDHVGASGSGSQDANGFDTAVIYDLNVDIAGATRAGGSPVAEGTSDGPNNGPGFGPFTSLAVSDFGPIGSGAAVSFSPEPGFTTASAIASAASGATDNGPTTDFHADSDRLAAGAYVGTVTLVLRPGI
jgi:hypothetical protein